MFKLRLEHLLLLLPCYPLSIAGENSFLTEEIELQQVESGHTINFHDVPVIEFVRFVSKIAEVNFIFDNKDLQFSVTLASGKPVSSASVFKALVQMLRVHGFAVTEEENYYVIHKGESSHLTQPLIQHGEGTIPSQTILAGNSDKCLLPLKASNHALTSSREFSIYKLKYHQGAEIEDAIKKIAGDLQQQPDCSTKLLEAIKSMQWVKSTNSLLYSADDETIVSMRKLIDSLDVPLKQVFIEVLVVETDVRKNLEFGLEWAAGGQYNKLGFGSGSFPPNGKPSPFASSLQGINPTNMPTGLNQIPIGGGFDLGVIGDIIIHKGKSYLTLGGLVSALQADGDSTIVLNQKIITQENKNSRIFVGDNIPFTGSVVQTVGQSQQTTANIEYRDIGVSLSITPMLGEDNVITLDLDEEITESLNDPMASSSGVNGIRTTKTNMVTHVHVPDKHFLVLSGMIRNAKSNHKTGVPCLGGLPFIGAAFSKTKEQQEKRNVAIFVRPHIIHSFEDYRKLTQNQEQVYQLQSAPGNFAEAIDILPPID